MAALRQQVAWVDAGQGANIGIDRAAVMGSRWAHVLRDGLVEGCLREHTDGHAGAILLGREVNHLAYLHTAVERRRPGADRAQRVALQGVLTAFFVPGYGSRDLNPDELRLPFRRAACVGADVWA